MYYRLNIDEGKKKKYACGVGLGTWPETLVSCPVCNREWKKSLMHNYGIEIPIVITNDNFPDFLYYYIIHITKKASCILEHEGISGYLTERAKIISNNQLSDVQKKELRSDGVKIRNIPDEFPEYFKMHVKIGADYHEDSGRFLKEICTTCGYELYINKGEFPFSNGPIILKKESLIGLDLFTSIGYGNSIFCSERFLDVYKKNELTGLVFDEIEVR